MNSRVKWTVVGSSTVIVLLLLASAVNGRGVTPDDVYGHLKVYTEVLQRIKLEYVEEPDMKNVTLGAINGLLESVDPFASYLNADQYRQYEKMQDSARAGVGLVIAKRFGYVAVIDSVPDSPAEKANIASGDLIESINGVATRDMPLAYAEQLLRGAPNTTVNVTVLRIKNPEPQKVELTRTLIPNPPVSAKLVTNEVGYLHTNNLSGKEIESLKTKLKALKDQGAKYFVLDLRHCSTGDQTLGVNLANLFLDKGVIASLQGQKTAKQEFTAKPDQQIWSGPLVLITNHSTAGGAEIAAAALLDDKRAQIVGERSYGDASLRKTIEMDDGGAVILSVAKYYAPSGKAIQDTGVVPSVQVAESETVPDPDDDAKPPSEAPATKPGEDLLLKRSIDLVTGRTTVAQLTQLRDNDVDGKPPSNQKAPILGQPK